MQFNFSKKVFKICRTCLRVLSNNSSFIKFDCIGPNDTSTVQHKLNIFAPELDLTLLPNAVICYDCFIQINSFYLFKTSCLRVETQIQNYIQKVFGVKDTTELLQVARLNLPLFTNLVHLVETDNIVEDKTSAVVHSRNEEEENFNCSVDDLVNSLNHVLHEALQHSSALEMDYKLEDRGIWEDTEDHVANREVPTQLPDAESGNVPCNIEDSPHTSCVCVGFGNSEDPVCNVSDVQTTINQNSAQQLVEVPISTDISKGLNVDDQRKCVVNLVKLSDGVIKFNTKPQGNPNKIAKVQKYNLKKNGKRKVFSCKLCKYHSNHRPTTLKGSLKTQIDNVHRSKCQLTDQQSISSYIQSNESDINAKNLQGCFVKVARLPNSVVYSKIIAQINTRGSEFLNDFVQKFKHFSAINRNRFYFCNLCDYKNIRLSNVRRHVASIHTDERSYVCYVCGYQAGEKHILREHIRIHTGDKPFKCKLCDYSSVHRTSLNRHVSSYISGKLL